MKITVELIKSFNPCRDRMDNFIQYHPDFEGSEIDFLALENVSISDKIWVSIRVMDKNQLVRLGAKCAESVLWLHSDSFSEDRAPLLAVEAAKASLRFPDKINLDEAMNNSAYSCRIAENRNKKAAADAARAAFCVAAGARVGTRSVMFTGGITAYIQDAIYSSMSAIDRARLERGQVDQDQQQLVLNFLRDTFLGR